MEEFNKWSTKLEHSLLHNYGLTITLQAESLVVRWKIKFRGNNLDTFGKSRSLKSTSEYTDTAEIKIS